ncbi:MAG TPA: hypothetical protein VF708_14865 [Pyrinomonadaceae bacterium]
MIEAAWTPLPFISCSASTANRITRYRVVRSLLNPSYSFLDDLAQAKLSKTLQNANAGLGWVRFAKPRREENGAHAAPCRFSRCG